MVGGMPLSDWLPNPKKAPGEQIVSYAVSLVVSWLAVKWASAQENAPDITSLGWLCVFVALAFALLFLIAVAGWVAGWVRRQWLTPPASANSRVVTKMQAEKRSEDAAETLAVTPVRQREKTAYEIEQRLRALDGIIALLRETPWLIEHRGNSLRQRVQSAFHNKDHRESYRSELMSFLADIKAFREKLAKLKSEHITQGDLVLLLSEAGDKALFAVTEQFIKTYDRMVLSLRDDAAGDAFWDWLAPRNDSFKQALGFTHEWRDRALVTAIEFKKRV